MKRFAELLYRGAAISLGVAAVVVLLALALEEDIRLAGWRLGLWRADSGMMGPSEVTVLFLTVSCIGAVISAVVAAFVASEEAGERTKQEANRAKQEAEAAALATKAEQQRQESIAAEQRALLIVVVRAASEAKKRAADLPQLAQSAERAIDKAELEFADGVFAPFWDAVETATTNLAEFEHIVQLLVQRSRDYKNAAAKFLGSAPAFEVGVKALPDVTHASARLKAIVRQAQKNPHFATIYELRKTNEILVEGFTNLGQALTEVGDRLESSMDTLRSSLTEGFAEVASSNQKASEQLLAQMEQTREQSANDSREAREMSTKESEARRKHEHDEREMLNNIQRRKKPRS